MGWDSPLGPVIIGPSKQRDEGPPPPTGGPERSWRRIGIVAVAALVVSMLLSCLAVSRGQPTPPAVSTKNFDRAHSFLAGGNPYSDGGYRLAALLDSVESEARDAERMECIRIVRECLED